MKTNLYFGSAIIAAFSLAACSDNSMIENHISNAQGQEIRISASLGADTRVAVEEADDQLKFTWTEGDYFVLVNGMQATQFNLITGAGTGRGEFSGTLETSIANGEKIYGVYNPSLTADQLLDAEGNAIISLGDQTGKLTDKYQYMFAESVYKADSDVPVSFKFNHLVSILKVSMTLPAGVTSIDKLELMDNCFATEAKVVINTPKSSHYVNPYYESSKTFGPGEIVYDHADNSTYKKTVTISDLEVKDNVATAYFYVLPAYAYGEGQHQEPYITPKFMAYSGSNVFMSSETFYGQTIEGGKMYEIDTNLSAVPQLQDGENIGLDENTYYAITSTEDCVVEFENCYGWRFMNEPQNVGGWLIPAGKTYLVQLSGNRCTLVRTPVKAASVEQKLTEKAVYKFIPESDGYYGLVESNASSFWSVNNKNNMPYLTAGKEYYFSCNPYFDNGYTTVYKANECTMTEGEPVVVDNCAVVSFTPSTSGSYFTRTNNVSRCWVDFENVGDDTYELEANETYTILVRRTADSGEGATISVIPVDMVEVEFGKTYNVNSNTVFNCVVERVGDVADNSAWYYFDIKNSYASPMQWNIVTRLNSYGNYYHYIDSKTEEYATLFRDACMRVAFINVPTDDNISITVRKYPDTKIVAEVNTEYTIEKDTPVTYIFTAPEDGEYEIVRQEQISLDWQNSGGSTTTLTAGQTAIFYAVVPADAESSVTFTIKKK